MAYVSICKGIIFIESKEPSSNVLAKVEYKTKFSLFKEIFKSDRETLDAVKEQLADKVIALGGNCVVEFKYGQKNKKWFEMSAENSVKWYGEGFAAIIPEERKAEIIEKLNKN